MKIYKCNVPIEKSIMYFFVSNNKNSHVNFKITKNQTIYIGFEDYIPIHIEEIDMYEFIFNKELVEKFFFNKKIEEQIVTMIHGNLFRTIKKEIEELVGNV